MRPYKNLLFLLFFSFICQANQTAYGQLGINFNLKKPKEYEDRQLRSEKTGEKKFTLPRRFIQNTVTHFNYVFNATEKLNQILETAKAQHKDDYSKLIPFYNYSLDVTSTDSLSLDSIIDKSQTGIALHDLRNDWVDNLYLLWGQAYYLRKDFDSAYLMFQFINYAFVARDKDGYAATIGSPKDGNTNFSIASKEKTNLGKKLLSEPPSRNDAFIWQIRNLLARDEFAEAASLIITLKSDPNLPSRLNNDLEEVQALWFYKQNNWDSAAVHLSNALSTATNPQEKARWEYLIGQLYELSGKYKEAENYYGKVIGHTTDLVLEIYARLATIRVNKDGGENYIDKNIAELLKMAKRDKYTDYRDIIYYMAAQMELERNNINGALALLQKSAQVPSNDPSIRTRAFLQLAELTLAKKQYQLSYNFHDSLDLNDPSLEDKKQMLGIRKNWLEKVALSLEIINREDSLQRLAAMDEDARKSFVRDVVRDLRKKQGLKDEPLTTGSIAGMPTDQPSLFGGSGSSSSGKGEWYFYNAASKQKGQADFKARWGNRPNVDNWRRSSMVSSIIQGKNDSKAAAAAAATLKPGQQAAPTEITFDALYANVPLTPEAKKASDSSLAEALYIAGKTFVQEAEDCEEGTSNLERVRSVAPDFEKMNEVYFNLYYCYNKSGETAKAAAIKKLMSDKFPADRYTQIVTTGKDPQSKSANSEATKTYEKIYDLFIEGNFTEATTQKRIADSIYGNNYWTPQLLYIESVYYIKQKEDSSAIGVLNNIIGQFPNTVMATKATTMIDVLKRRKQIEEELTRLNITRPADPENTRPIPQQDTTRLVAIPKRTLIDTATKIPQPKPVVTNPIKDSVVTKAPIVTPTAPTAFAFDTTAAHYVVLVLNKVDPVFMNEAKNAFFRYNRETYYNKQFTTELSEYDTENKLLLIAPFKNSREAIDYITKAKPLTPTEIIPWLKGGKYEFTIISESNLGVIKTNKSLGDYKIFISNKFPGKF
jgi:hypothetical protein